jgi:hypothetical protein
MLWWWRHVFGASKPHPSPCMEEKATAQGTELGLQQKGPVPSPCQPPSPPTINNLQPLVTQASAGAGCCCSAHPVCTACADTTRTNQGQLGTTAAVGVDTSPGVHPPNTACRTPLRAACSHALVDTLPLCITNLRVDAADQLGSKQTQTTSCTGCDPACLQQVVRQSMLVAHRSHLRTANMVGRLMSV